VPIADKDIIGLGETPALEPPVVTNIPRLEDPETVLGMTSKHPGFAAAYEKWSVDHNVQTAYWPLWRKAQLRVDGQVIISAGGRQQP
jgi:hypothetical protein